MAMSNAGAHLSESSRTPLTVNGQQADVASRV